MCSLDKIHKPTDQTPPKGGRAQGSRCAKDATGAQEVTWPLHPIGVALAYLPPWGGNEPPAPNPHLLDVRNSDALITHGEKEPCDAVTSPPGEH